MADARARTRLKKLRLLAIVIASMGLGLVSFVFGMFMAVASDLGKLEADAGFTNAQNSVLLDERGQPIAVLTEQSRIYVKPNQVPQIVSEAVVAVEDKRFYTNDGIDLRGVARAFVQDILHKRAVQGASTIEEQFVKNSLAAQGHRTIFEKLREAALAYHLTREWKKTKILTEYLNTIYFGNGAYGIESAARTYFGDSPNHTGCGTLKRLCVSELEPAEAALLAGIIASPSEFDPATHPQAALGRRNLVLYDMFEQGYLTASEYQASIHTPLPPAPDIQPPQEVTTQGLDTGYFDSWVTQLALQRYSNRQVFQGGLKIHTTLDLGLQKAAENAVNTYLSNPDGPSAALVVIDNPTGEVRAMVGGRDYNTTPFNLATQGERQPGSAWKAFDLAAALTHNISPDSIWNSHTVSFKVSGQPLPFVVHNDEDSNLGPITLTEATAVSDNTVYAQVGLHLGTHVVRHYALHMGIRTPISENAAMTIGGLHIGVTPLDMAHAYETLAHDGARVDGSLIHGDRGPVGIVSVKFPPSPNERHGHEDFNRTVLVHVLHPYVAQTETTMLEGVIQHGTGTNANIGTFAAGKTGTTSNYVDAWFVGWDKQYTVAVWVGYPQGSKSMSTDYNGGPVLGGTYPAMIWRNFMLAALALQAKRSGKPLQLTPVTPSSSTSTVTPAGTIVPAPTTSTTPDTTTTTPDTTGGTGTGAATPDTTGTAGTGAANTTGAAPDTTGATPGTAAPDTTTPPTPASTPPPAATTPPPAPSSTPAAPDTGAPSDTGTAPPAAGAPTGGAASPPAATPHRRGRRRLSARRTPANGSGSPHAARPRTSPAAHTPHRPRTPRRRRWILCERLGSTAMLDSPRAWTSASVGRHSRRAGDAGGLAARRRRPAQLPATFRLRGRGLRGSSPLGTPARRPPARGRRGWPRLGHAAAACHGEAPWQLDCLGDADTRPGDDRGLAPPRGRGEDAHRAGGQVAVVVGQRDRQRLRELARARAEIVRPPDAAAGEHQLHAGERLEGADQDRGADALVLAYGVEQLVNAV